MRHLFISLMLVSVTSLFFVSSVGANDASHQTLNLEAFYGEWQSDGDAFGQAAKSTLNWSPALAGKFVRVDYNIQTESNDNYQTIFTGIGYYKQLDNGKLKAFWADSSGDLHPITATYRDDTLVSFWGVAGEKLGRTEYQLVKSNELKVTDWIMQKHEWKQFNQNVFTRILSEESIARDP